ncbi:MAG: DUF2259 domain-containing protein [Spirochaetaceae bacterium]
MKKLSIFLFLILFTSFVYAGDVSNFVNLGFSSDGKYFLFGEYGIITDVQKAYANMWLVDVKKNSFVNGGTFSGEYKTVIEPGESSIGGLLKLLNKGSKKVDMYKIDHLEQGRPLYVRINDDDNVDILNFRDFMTGLKYKLVLNKKSRESGDTNYSSFGIDLETTDQNGKVSTYKLGNPSFERKNVIDYKIERILNSSTGNNIVVVISKYIKNSDSINIRYMVETISLK